MKIPCKDCLLVPICRHKLYMRLFGECKLIGKYIPYFDFAGEERDGKVEELEKTINPTAWSLGHRLDISSYKLVLTSEGEPFGDENS